MKSLSYDAQAAIIKAIDGDDLAVALHESRIARKELKRQHAILANREALGNNLPSSLGVRRAAAAWLALETQVRELEQLRTAQQRYTSHVC